MRPHTLPTALVCLVSAGLAVCAPNPKPIPNPEADPHIDSDGHQITLTSEAYYGSGSGVVFPPAPPAQSGSSESPSLPKMSDDGDDDAPASTFSVKATTSTDDEKRREYLDREGVNKEYDTLQELKEQLRELEGRVKEREGWFGEVICPKKSKQEVECASPACAFSKVFTSAAGGLRKRDTVGERCWEGSEKKEFPLPPWRGGHNGTEGGEEKIYSPPGWIKVLNSGVLEVLVIVLGVGLAVLSWGLMREGRQNNDEERGGVRRRGCCGMGWRRRREEEGVEEREKLAGFGEHGHEESQEEEEQRFEIGSESGSEDEVVRTTYNVPRLHYQQQEEAERRIQTWVPELGHESEGESMVADGIYTAPRPTFEQEDRERQLRDQDLAARQRYAPSESGSATLAGTQSPSEVDSLEGVSISQELAAFRDAFGLVEDLVANVEQRRRQI